jgi:hypothetical protein
MEPVADSFATVYPQIADRLAEQLPAVGWIDLDFGQLEQPEEGYALPWDAGVLLISFDEVAWEDLGQGVQRGEAEVRVTLAIQVAEDSYQASSQRGAALLRLQQLGQVHRALQHFAGVGFGAMVRTGSRKEPATRPGLWCYSHIYKTRLQDAGGYSGATEAVENLDTAPRGAVVAQLPAPRPAPVQPGEQLPVLELH